MYMTNLITFTHNASFFHFCNLNRKSVKTDVAAVLVGVAEPPVWERAVLRYTVCVFRERLLIFVRVLLPLLVLGWDVGFDCINS